ncbi:MAG: rhomboid family intramembrane serine protease [Desulfobacterales bacterium]|nr:rhomboid family intramembrane serine protease [Desulfobacterales bacterium]
MNQTRKSILCPNCRKLISSDEPNCPYCDIIRPGSWRANNFLTTGHLNTDKFIRMIIYVNVAMYVISLLLNPRLTNFSLNPFSFLSPDSKSLLLLGATGTYPVDQLHRWWSLVSANYLHGGILHILFNMFAFKQLAPLVTREYGVSRMFIIYTASGVIGFWISYLFNVLFTIGASASVCGLIGAMLFYGKSRGGVYGQAIYRQVVGWIVGLFLFGFMIPGINNWGHGGGILGGVLVGFILSYQEKKSERLVHKTMAVICIIATAAVLGWAIVSGVYYRLQ